MWFTGRSPSRLSHGLAMFDGHWPIAGGDITYLIYHVTPGDCVPEGSCDFMSQSSSSYATILPSLVDIEIVEVEI